MMAISSFRGLGLLVGWECFFCLLGMRVLQHDRGMELILHGADLDTVKWLWSVGKDVREEKKIDGIFFFKPSARTMMLLFVDSIHCSCMCRHASDLSRGIGSVGCKICLGGAIWG